MPPLVKVLLNFFVSTTTEDATAFFIISSIDDCCIGGKPNKPAKDIGLADDNDSISGEPESHTTTKDLHLDRMPFCLIASLLFSSVESALFILAEIESMLSNHFKVIINQPSTKNKQTIYPV